MPCEIGNNASIKMLHTMLSASFSDVIMVHLSLTVSNDLAITKIGISPFSWSYRHLFMISPTKSDKTIYLSLTVWIFVWLCEVTKLCQDKKPETCESSLWLTFTTWTQCLYIHLCACICSIRHTIMGVPSFCCCYQGSFKRLLNSVRVTKLDFTFFTLQSQSFAW